jgi:hypothetical protein
MSVEGQALQAAAPPASWFDVLTRGEAFERVYVLLALLFAAAAYFDAWTYVNTPNGKSLVEPWQDFALHLAWLLLTSFLVAVMAINIRRGTPLTRALPPEYGWCMVGCLGFSAMALIDRWGQALFGGELGLSALFSPPRVGEIVGSGMIVTGPLRAAWRRRDTEAGITAVISAALLLSTISFVTQFAHPYRDPWAAGTVAPSGNLYWMLLDAGVAALVLQGTALVATFLLLIRRFSLRLGSFTLICAINGVLVVPLKEHWEMLPAAVATGIAADLLYLWLRPSTARMWRLRSFAFLVPAIFAALFFLATALAHGIWWSGHVWSGTILITGLGGVLVSYLAFTPGGRQTQREPVAPQRPAHWPEISESSVKDAMEVLSDRAALAASPLCNLPYLARDGSEPVSELADLLRDIARELSTSTVHRNAQAGHLLVEYYVKRSGTHEQIAERLHLSRATYYHRLQHGCALVAERLDKLAGFTESIEQG